MLDELLTVREAQSFLKKNGISWGCVWIRRQMGRGTIKIERQLNSVGIRKSELRRVIREKK